MLFWMWNYFWLHNYKTFFSVLIQRLPYGFLFPNYLNLNMIWVNSNGPTEYFTLQIKINLSNSLQLS